MLYVGVDLHRKRSHLAALDEEGNLILSRRIASKPDDFARVFGELEPESLSVAFEARMAGAGSRTCSLTPASRGTWLIPWRPKPSPRGG